MPNIIQLIVGLANPGSEYAGTRHNAGGWLVEKLAELNHVSLRSEKKFHGRLGKFQLNGEDCFVFIPNTYMNESGRAIKAIASFYRIPAEAILVVHDELDLPTGVARIKQGGGDGGHNGLKDTTAQMSNNYWRLRIGIGHPGDRNKVHDYVLSNPSRDDYKKINTTIDAALDVLPQLISGETQKAIQQLHSSAV